MSKCFFFIHRKHRKAFGFIKKKLTFFFIIKSNTRKFALKEADDKICVG